MKLLHTFNVDEGKSYTLSMDGIGAELVGTIPAVTPVRVLLDNGEEYILTDGNLVIGEKFKKLQVVNDQVSGVGTIQVTVRIDVKRRFVSGSIRSQDIAEFCTTTVLAAKGPTNVVLAKPAIFGGGLQLINGLLCLRKEIILQNQDAAISAAIGDRRGGGDSVQLAPGVISPAIKTSDDVQVSSLGGLNSSINIAAIQTWYPLFKS